MKHKSNNYPKFSQKTKTKHNSNKYMPILGFTSSTGFKSRANVFNSHDTIFKPIISNLIESIHNLFIKQDLC